MQFPEHLEDTPFQKLWKYIVEFYFKMHLHSTYIYTYVSKNGLKPWSELKSIKFLLYVGTTEQQDKSSFNPKAWLVKIALKRVQNVSKKII